MSDKKTIAISGGMDPIHIGHVKMIQAAAELGELTVILNSDAWLKRKKGYVFMPYEERKYLLESVKGVSVVSAVDDTDGTVCEALQRLQPDMFGNGGDRTSDNTPEKEVCLDIGIRMIWNLGGQKVQSSSELVRTYVKNKSINSELNEFKKTLEEL
jgi:D-beta-D-heptose 7-phosphate kinase/D-beta-D-heptose 1-phosphate adenosyltransferase